MPRWYNEIQLHQVGLDCPCNILPRTQAFRGVCVQYCTHPCVHLLCCYSPKNLPSHISECSQVKHRSSTYSELQPCGTQLTLLLNSQLSKPYMCTLLWSNYCVLQKESATQIVYSWINKSCPYLKGEAFSGINKFYRSPKEEKRSSIDKSLMKIFKMERLKYRNYFLIYLYIHSMHLK